MHRQSRDARDAFRLRHAEAFRALDERCEAFTGRETLLGDLDVVSDADGAIGA